MTDGYHSMTPTAPLAAGETVQHSFRPDRSAYWRDHAWMAAGAMAIGMAALWIAGNPHVWTGAVGGLAAIAVRAFYVASDELQARWDMTETRLLGPQNRTVRLSEIAQLRTLGSAVQIVTNSGDKHLLKYQADRDATRSRLRRAMAGGRG
ncbi:hypothetical protein [Thalassovita taeanensis]|uniref:PH domain-containing protein n=1 Tax=Thalassovita taeanensis TaxID=657014 RepID=A0A1H9ATK9_9RHOB|nr:hypothetical protein [Thalassovita taeanensis]SEP79979.1 hypothetical protein SAMN04488092_102257 [Thalassovita taeanensis]